MGWSTKYAICDDFFFDLICQQRKLQQGRRIFSESKMTSSGYVQGNSQEYFSWNGRSLSNGLFMGKTMIRTWLKPSHFGYDIFRQANGSILAAKHAEVTALPCRRSRLRPRLLEQNERIHPAFWEGQPIVSKKYGLWWYTYELQLTTTHIYIMVWTCLEMSATWHRHFSIYMRKRKGQEELVTPCTGCPQGW